jgi:hypothetical protein
MDGDRGRVSQKFPRLKTFSFLGYLQAMGVFNIISGRGIAKELLILNIFGKEQE